MRSTKTNFYSSKDNRGGGFTGTKDSNFTKDQANEGRYYKPNSLKLTLINPLGWRKHEEIWGNLVSLKLGIRECSIFARFKKLIRRRLIMKIIILLVL